MVLGEGEAAVEAVRYVTKSALLRQVIFPAQVGEGGPEEVRHRVQALEVVWVFELVE